MSELALPQSSAVEPDLAGASNAACAAVLRLRGDMLAAELGRIAGQLTACPHATFVAAVTDAGSRPRAGLPGAWHYAVEIDGVQYGYFELSGPVSVEEPSQRALASLATMIASLMQMQSLAQRSTHA